MREPEEIEKEKQANFDEMKKWFPHLNRESARKIWNELVEKDIALDKELTESMEAKYKIKLHW